MTSETCNITHMYLLKSKDTGEDPPEKETITMTGAAVDSMWEHREVRFDILIT